jgi:hypothetical protein
MLPGFRSPVPSVRSGQATRTMEENAVEAVADAPMPMSEKAERKWLP